MHESLQALPVLVTVSHARSASVLRYVDGVLGWQSVSHDEGTLLRARVQLTDNLAHVTAGMPAVLLVDDAGVSAATAKQFASHGPVAVCIWPAEREKLPDVVRGVLTPQVRESGLSLLTVGGATGGVGATTAALALGGVAAYDGRNTLIVVNDVSSRARQIDVAALADPNLWDQATPIAGCDFARMVRINSRPVLPEIRDVRVALCVHDSGVSADVDILVMRPDRGGMYALKRTTAAVVMVIGDGVVPASQIKKVAGSRRVVAVERSVRVARAVANERVPAGVPGRWLEPFRQVWHASGIVRSG